MGSGAQRLLSNYQSFVLGLPSRPHATTDLFASWLKAQGAMPRGLSDHDWLEFLRAVGVREPEEQWGCMERVAECSGILARAQQGERA